MAGKHFTQTLAEIRGGLVEAELSEQLNALVERIQETGKAGTISLQLKISPHGKGNREMHVQAKIATNMPAKPDMDEPSVFFAVRGDLVRDDPEQRSLFGPRSSDGLQVDGRSPAEQRAMNA